MNITDYILNEIKPLPLNGSVKAAKKVFNNFSITHFPMVENNIYLGCFAQEDIQTIENNNDNLAAYKYLLISSFTDEKATVLELLKIFADNSTNIIPVLSEEKEYIGYYDLCDTLDVFSTSPFMMEKSETLIIEKLESDYSMAEVAQIVESNGGKLLGMYLSEKHQNLVQITLKISTEDIHEIMHAYRRYDYKIISTHANDMYLEDLKNRSDYLQKYLEM